jgi:hypothetical protein
MEAIGSAMGLPHRMNSVPIRAASSLPSLIDLGELGFCRWTTLFLRNSFIKGTAEGDR